MADLKTADLRTTLNDRYEGVAWGLFLVMLGALWLLPARSVPDDTWLLGGGLILLALNGARLLSGIPVSVFTTILGAGAVLLGAAQMYGVDVPAFALFVIAIGTYLVIRAITRDRVAAAHM